MATPPARTELADTYPLPSNATFRTGIGKLYDYVTTLLGASGSAADARAALSVPDFAGHRNRLFNPSGGEIYQRAIAATADDAYFADRWFALTQTGTVMPSTLTDPENGYAFGGRLTQSQAAAQRFGFGQIIEGRFCKDMRGGSGILVPRIRISNSQAIRYAILGWTGTEDAVTSDVVSDWTSSSFTAGGFFLGSNISVIACSSATPSANAWTSLPAIYAALGSTFTNIIIMVWTEGTAAQNVTLDFDWMQFEKGQIATPPDRRLIELMLCQRYFAKSYSQGTAPGAATSTGVTSLLIAPVSTGPIFTSVSLPVEMRDVPNITLYDTAGASGKVNKGGTGKAGSVVYQAARGFNAGTNDTTSANELNFQWVAEKEL